MQALEGLLVVALEQAVAAPLCTSRLADAGARVIKVERPDGDFARRYDNVVHGDSAYFVWLNAGKESIALDIKAPQDAALLRAILARADVFIQNLAPGAAARAGFGSADLRARHPRLITCDISGYGETGPWAEMKAYDFLIQCEAGLAAVTGPPEQAARVGVSVADIACGMNAHAAILQALYARERTGQGAGVAVSLFDGLADWMAVPLLHLEHGGEAPPRAGLRHSSIAPYGAYHTMGGEIVFSVQNDREWSAFCREVLGDPGLAENPRFATNGQRDRNRPELDAVIDAVLGSLTVEQTIARLKAANVAYGRLNDVAGLSAHPQLRRRPAQGSGPIVPLPALPWRWADAPPSEARRVPQVGEHTDRVRREFS